MDKKMRIMTEKPLNAETLVENLKSWITPNNVFFDRNQGEIPETPVSLDNWKLIFEGEVEKPMAFNYREICHMPKAIVANTLECSGNSRSLLETKAQGNPWTIGGVGNAVWSGVWLKDLMNQVVPTTKAKHVAFEGFDKSLGKAGISFIRSIPLEKAVDSTLLAYEMNGEPLPIKHGFPLRGLALGWTGANCIKWLYKITLLEHPFEGFFMDKVYRKFQKNQDPKQGEIVTGINLKSIITQPESGEKLEKGRIVVLGAAYAGTSQVERVDISTDHGATWYPADFIGPDERFAWRQWQYEWVVDSAGEYTIMVRAMDNSGNLQPMNADWNVLGYGNNGIREHAVTVHIT